MPVLFIVRLWWLPRAREAFMAAHETNSITNGALAEGIHGVRTVQSMDRQSVNFDLYDDKAHANLLAHLRGVEIRADHGADRRYADRHRHGGCHRRRRLDGRAQQPRHRRDGGVPVLHPALLRSDPLAHPAIQRHAAGDGVGPAASPRCSTCRSMCGTAPDAVASAARHRRLRRVQATSPSATGRGSRC